MLWRVKKLLFNFFFFFLERGSKTHHVVHFLKGKRYLWMKQPAVRWRKRRRRRRKKGGFICSRRSPTCPGGRGSTAGSPGRWWWFVRSRSLEESRWSRTSSSDLRGEERNSVIFVLRWPRGSNHNNYKKYDLKCWVSWKIYMFSVND